MNESHREPIRRPKVLVGSAEAALWLALVCETAACSQPIPCENGQCNASGEVDAALVSPVFDAARADAQVAQDTSVADAESDSAALPPAAPCDASRILARKCGLCHGEDPSAPVRLVTPADFHALARDGQTTLSALALAKITADDPRGAMPPASASPLTQGERDVLAAWLRAGAPAQTAERCAPELGPAEDDAGLPPADDDDLECFQFLAHNGDGRTPLNVGIALDSYTGFTFAAPWKETAYAVTFRAIVDNKRALHHWQFLQDLSAGIPGGPTGQSGVHMTTQLVAVWAPGGDDMDLRRSGHDVGMELPANTTYTLELHYNSDDLSAKDASGVEVCIARAKPKNTAAYTWMGFDNLAIPSTNWKGTCTPTSQEPIQIVSLMPHMHIKGIHMKGTLRRKDGTEEVIHDAPFDFQFQRSYAADITVYPGDSITTECTFSEPMLFGKNTNQEMCYLFALAYPQGALVSPDVWGVFAHGPSSCLGQ